MIPTSSIPHLEKIPHLDLTWIKSHNLKETLTFYKHTSTENTRNRIRVQTSDQYPLRRESKWPIHQTCAGAAGRSLKAYWHTHHYQLWSQAHPEKNTWMWKALEREGCSKISWKTKEVWNQVCFLINWKPWKTLKPICQWPKYMAVSSVLQGLSNKSCHPDLLGGSITLKRWAVLVSLVLQHDSSVSWHNMMKLSLKPEGTFASRRAWSSFEVLSTASESWTHLG